MRAPLALLLLLGAAPASAAEVNGYVESRTQYSRSRVDGLLPTDALPEVQQLLEFNTQPRVEYRPGGLVAGDLSLFLQAAGRYRGLDASHNEVSVRPSEASAAAYRPIGLSDAAAPASSAQRASSCAPSRSSAITRDFIAPIGLPQRLRPTYSRASVVPRPGGGGS